MATLARPRSRFVDLPSMASNQRSLLVQGFGLQANCTTRDVQITEPTRSAFDSVYFATSVALGYNYSDPAVSAGAQAPSWISINATYLPANFTQTTSTESDSPNPVYTKTLVQKICLLYGGTVTYDVILQNDTVQLKYDDWRQDKVLETR